MGVCMTEIRIERKDRSIWPWVLGALALLLVLWVVFDQDDTDEVMTAAVTDSAAVEDTAFSDARPAAVTTFIEFANRPDAATAQGLEHEYSADGIDRLADAIESVGGASGPASEGLSTELEYIRARADSLRMSEVGSEGHAGLVRSAFQSAATAFGSMPLERYPDLENQISGIGNAADAIDARTLLLEQKAEVRAFFSEAAEALEGMRPRDSGS